MKNLLYITAALIFTGCVRVGEEAKPPQSVPVGFTNDTTIAAVGSDIDKDSDTARYPIGFDVTVEDWKLKKE